MSTRRETAAAAIGQAFGGAWTPKAGDPDAGSAALAVAVALLRALRDRGLLTQGEIDDIFGEAASRFGHAGTLKLLGNVRSAVELKDEE